MTPDDVAAVFARQDHDESSTTEASDGTPSGRIEALGPVLSEVRGLWESGDEKLDLIAQKIGDGSREGQSILMLLLTQRLHYSQDTWYSSIDVSTVSSLVGNKTCYFWLLLSRVTIIWH